MDQTALELKLQNEIDALVNKNKDVFNAVLGVVDAASDFHWVGAAGTAYPDESQAMTVNTPIFIASITKMYTAATSMILAERELLSLDDPLSKFLPASMVEGLHVYKGRDYSDQLRVYHLISQTSGLPDYFEERPSGEQSMLEQLIDSGDKGWGVEDVVRIGKSGLSPKFPPESKSEELTGKKAHYSDTNYQLLGAVIEEAGQKPLPELFSELITEPMGLSATYLYGREDPKTTPEIRPANIYYKTQPLYLDKAMTSFGPDGGMVSSVEDSLKFLRQIMEGRLFSDPSTLQRMKSWRKIFFPFQYGLGLMRFKLPRVFSPFSAPPELIGHSGASSAFLFYSEKDQIYLGGTLNQLDNRRRPFGLMLKVIKFVSESPS